MGSAAKIITACVAFAAAIGAGIYALTLQNNDENIPTFENVTEATTTVTTTEVLQENWDEVFGYEPSPKGMTERAEMYLRQNRDIIGWIKINNTQLDYPIVKDPGSIKPNTGYGNTAYDPNYYYLHKDLDGNYLFDGTVFMDYRNVFDSSEENQSENIVLYGHNMNNGSMFGSLRKYRQDYSYYDENPFIELSSNYKDYQYIIFGFLPTSGTYGKGFDYWHMEELDNEEDFNFYVDTVKSRALLDTGVDVRYGDKLLTLSTCISGGDNMRFIVVGRRLRDHEIPGDVSSIDRTKDYLDKLKAEETETQEQQVSE